MSRKKTNDLISHLDTGERAQVLGELLKRHPDLREEACVIAANLIDDVSIEAVADEVADLVTSIGHEELGSRAGKHSWGYIKPSQAAWDLLEKSIEGLRDDMRRRFEAGMTLTAEKICQGIVLGLYSVRNTIGDGALAWAEDFPAEAAAFATSTLIELYPASRRRAAGKRIITAAEEHAKDWVEMLLRVVERAASAKRRGQK